jgi:hypothetical protein
MQRIGREGDERRRAERADHQAKKGGHAVEERSALAVGIEDRSTQCRCRRADAQALHGTREDQLPDIIGIGEQHHRDGIQQQTAENDRTASDIIGQAADGQQRGQQADRIDRKHQRDHQRREVHRLLVEPVQRRHRAAAGCDQRGPGKTECRHGRWLQHPTGSGW